MSGKAERNIFYNPFVIMSQTLAYIDTYFSGSFSEEDKMIFETRCLTDNDFAKEVAFYITARGGLKDMLVVQKKQAFDDLYKQLSASHHVLQCNLEELS